MTRPPRRTPRSCALALAAALALALAPAPAGAKVEEGQRALPFKGTDFLSGSALDLEPAIGSRVIILDFGSIYCSSCMVTVPNLIKLRKQYPADDLAIFNIYLDIYNPQRVVKFFRGFAGDIGVNLLIDERLEISRSYGVDTLPTTFIIDRAGTVRRRIVGYTEADEREIGELVGRLISEQGVPSAVEGEGGRGKEPFTVYVPESFTKTTQQAVHVVGYAGGAGIRDVSLKLNNLPERTAPAKNNVFHFDTPLSLAMNLIEIKGVDAEGRTQSQSVVIFRETRIGGEISSELPSYRFHRDEEKRPCEKCHVLEASLADKSATQQSEVCNSCHGDLARHVFTHGPVTVGGCLPCHDYQSFPNRYELRSQGGELCFGCHDRVKEQIASSAYVHGPVAAGICTVCHDPHGADERFLLTRRQDRLCLSCHQDMLRELVRPTVHRPIEEGTCTGCHDPHASNTSKMLVLPREELCGKCHDFSRQQHMHKVGVGPETEFPEGTLLSREGTTICITCHLVHSSEQPYLWRGEKAMCGRGCHTSANPEAE